MSDGESMQNRRDVLKKGGAAAAGLVSTTGVGAAAPGQRGPPDHAGGPPAKSQAQENSPVHTEKIGESEGDAVHRVAMNHSGGDPARNPEKEFVVIEHSDGSVSVARPKNEGAGSLPNRSDA